MPGCSVFRCSNSTEKGFKLFHFPSDNERRALWAKKCVREKGWKPTRNMCICEVHFKDSQFELKADGSRKLKPNAVPALFNDDPAFYRREKSNRIFEKSNHTSGIQITLGERKSDTNIGTIPSNILPNDSKTKLENNIEKGKSEKRNRNVSTDVSSVTHTMHKSQLNNQKTSSKDVKTKETKKSLDKHTSLFSKNSLRSLSQTTDSENEKRKLEGKSKRNKSEERNGNISTDVSSITHSVPKSEINNQTILNKKIKIILPKIEMEKDASIKIKDSSHVSKTSDLENEGSNQKRGLQKTLKRRKLDKNTTTIPTGVLKDESYLDQKKKLNVWVTSEAQHSHQSNKSSEVPNQFSKFEQEDNNEEDQEIIFLGNGITHVDFECDICSYKTKYQASMRFHEQQHFQSKFAYGSCPVEERQTTEESYEIIDVSDSESDKSVEILSC